MDRSLEASSPSIHQLFWLFIIPAEALGYSIVFLLEIFTIGAVVSCCALSPLWDKQSTRMKMATDLMLSKVSLWFNIVVKVRLFLSINHLLKTMRVWSCFIRTSYLSLMSNVKINQRVKYCAICNIDYDVMFRVQYKHPKEWVFVCQECLNKVKPNNPNYRYGGTWKR